MDWHLDPPEEPEPPMCPEGCGGYSDWENCEVKDGFVHHTCDSCGHKWKEPEQPEYDPGPEPVEELPDDFYEGPEKCPHGKKWGECDACDYLSDIAYDAARER